VRSRSVSQLEAHLTAPDREIKRASSRCRQVPSSASKALTRTLPLLAAAPGLPAQWSTLSNLVTLELDEASSAASFNGSASIPPSWTALTALQRLSARKAALGGSALPPQLSVLTGGRRVSLLLVPSAERDACSCPVQACATTESW
jgi:hypothetical protein